MSDFGLSAASAAIVTGKSINDIAPQEKIETKTLTHANSPLNQACWAGTKLLGNVAGEVASTGKLALSIIATGALASVPYKLGILNPVSTAALSMIPTAQQWTTGFDTSISGIFSHETKKNNPLSTFLVGQLPTLLTKIPSVAAITMILNDYQGIIIPLLKPHIGDTVAGYITTTLPVVSEWALAASPYVAYLPLVMAGIGAGLCLWQCLQELETGMDKIVSNANEFSSALKGQTDQASTAIIHA
ncbi:hypothetical protein [uncultured Shewanella sp.]|uniref:hypothetical protein n=1 Tax=uncultured Shewanella sp. TaxID=173975 RepID=UPI0026156724|nr:hypothetical protein [uncultured Shewanella sp.]